MHCKFIFAAAHVHRVNRSLFTGTRVVSLKHTGSFLRGGSQPLWVRQSIMPIAWWVGCTKSLMRIQVDSGCGSFLCRNSQSLSFGNLLCSYLVVLMYLCQTLSFGPCLEAFCVQTSSMWLYEDDRDKANAETPFPSPVPPMLPLPLILDLGFRFLQLPTRAFLFWGEVGCSDASHSVVLHGAFLSQRKTQKKYMLVGSLLPHWVRTMSAPTWPGTLAQFFPSAFDLPFSSSHSAHFFCADYGNGSCHLLGPRGGSWAGVAHCLLCPLSPRFCSFP